MARVAPRDDVAVSLIVECFDVVVDWDFRPVLSQNSLAVWVLLTECDGAKRSGSFEAEAESADSREEIKDFIFIQYPQSISPAIIAKLTHSQRRILTRRTFPRILR